MKTADMLTKAGFAKTTENIDQNRMLNEKWVRGECVVSVFYSSSEPDRMVWAYVNGQAVRNLRHAVKHP
jgi:hypothetical protein